MQKLYELKLIEKMTTSRVKDFKAIGYAFSLLHKTLVSFKNKGKDINIAFKPLLVNNTNGLVSISFFAKELNEIELFEKILKGEETIDFSITNEIKVINEYFSFNPIKEISFEIANSVIYKRKRLFLDSISKNKLIDKINFVLKNKEYEFPRETTKGKIKLLIDLLEITPINVNDKYKLVQERLKKEHNEFFISINSISTNKENINFSFKEDSFDKESLNFKVNSYGLSTEEFIFPIPY